LATGTGAASSLEINVPPAKDPTAAQFRAAGLAAWLFPSLADVLFIVLLGFILGLRSHQLLNSDGDLARHLVVGQQILSTGSIPTVDLFSHTKGGESFVPYEWLSETLFAMTYQRLGLEGVAVLAAGLAALPFLLLARWMVRDGINIFLTLTLVTIGALAASMHWLARPHLFTTLLALLWARILEDYRRTGRQRYLLLLPPMMALWANLHGGFLIGFVVLGIYLVGIPLERGVARRKRAMFLAAAGTASLAAVGLNPAGYSVLPHVLSYFQYRFLVDTTQEYLSPNFHGLGPQLFLALVLLALVSLAALPKRASITGTLLISVWTFFSCYSARNIPLFVILTLPTIGLLATQALGAAPSPLAKLAGCRSMAERLAATERRMGRALVPALAVMVALLIATGSLGQTRLTVEFDPKVFPIQALASLDQVGVQGRMFNYFPWGGYVLYAGYPKHRVFIDGQTDFYGEELTKDYVKVLSLEPDWEDILARYQIGWVLFPHQSPLSLMLARTPGWRLAYQDDTADIFVREGSPQ